MSTPPEHACNCRCKPPAPEQPEPQQPEPKPSDHILRDRKSRFVDIFRSTPAKTVCPNFFVLSHANGCMFHCEYCYLKSSLWHVPHGEAFGNVDRMIEEVRRWIARDDLESYVLNSGNLSDSLVFEQVRPLVARLVEVFREAHAAGRKHALLLVTKGGRHECGALTAAQSCPNVIVSFSVNSPEVAKLHERGASPPAERMAAARELKAAGWRVRIRIDPMFAGYDYGPIAEEIRQLAPERITLGTLRAEPHLRRIVNHGLFSELEVPPEAKALARYPMAQRLEIYRSAVDVLGSVCPIGLCEETRDVWDALGLDADSQCCNCGL